MLFCPARRGAVGRLLQPSEGAGCCGKMTSRIGCTGRQRCSSKPNRSVEKARRRIGPAAFSAVPTPRACASTRAGLCPPARPHQHPHAPEPLLLVHPPPDPQSLTNASGSCPSIVMGENAAMMGKGTSAWSGPDAKWYARQTQLPPHLSLSPSKKQGRHSLPVFARPPAPPRSPPPTP